MTLPLRERKKRKTRRLLVETAQRLFFEQGYVETTLEQICDEAEVSVATLIRYFESKERLALYPWYRTLDRFRAAIRDREPEAEVVTVWRRWVEDEANRHPKGPGAGVTIWNFITSAPELVARILAIHQEIEDLLAGALAQQAGLEPAGDLYGQMLAATLVASNRTAYRHWVERGAKDDLRESVLATVDFVLDNFPRRHERSIRSS